MVPFNNFPEVLEFLLFGLLALSHLFLSQYSPTLTHVVCFECYNKLNMNTFHSVPVRLQFPGAVLSPGLLVPPAGIPRECHLPLD